MALIHFYLQGLYSVIIWCMSGLVKGTPGSPEGTDEYYLDNRVEVKKQCFEIVKCNTLIFRALEPSCSGRLWDSSTSLTLRFESPSRFTPTSVPPALCSILESANNKRLPFSCFYINNTPLSFSFLWGKNLPFSYLNNLVHNNTQCV